MGLSLQLPGSRVVMQCAWFCLRLSKSGITWGSSLGRENTIVSIEQLECEYTNQCTHKSAQFQ